MIEYDKYPSYMFEVYYSLNYLMTNMFVWSCLAKIQTLDLFLDCNTMSQEAPIAPSGPHFPFAAPRFQQVKICEAALGCVWHLGLCTKNQEFFQLNTFEGFRLHFCHHRRNPAHVRTVPPRPGLMKHFLCFLRVLCKHRKIKRQCLVIQHR